MAPPAEFSYGPTDADADARYAARDRHGVQFPQGQLDQWKSVLPDIIWIQVHGEEGLTRVQYTSAHIETTLCGG